MSTALADAYYHSELVDGVETQKLPPKRLHARIQSYLILTLGVRLPDFLEVLGELNVLCGEDNHDRVIPDLTITRLDASYHDQDLADFGRVVCRDHVARPNAFEFAGQVGAHTQSRYASLLDYLA